MKYAKNETLQELLNMLEQKYGNLHDDDGCYVVDSNGEYVWLSVAEIVDTILELDAMYDWGE
jgi:hypothetical protein